MSAGMGENGFPPGMDGMTPDGPKPGMGMRPGRPRPRMGENGFPSGMEGMRPGGPRPEMDKKEQNGGTQENVLSAPTL